jgi:hypothetical protein
MIIFHQTIARKCHESIESRQLYHGKHKTARDGSFFTVKEAAAPRRFCATRIVEAETRFSAFPSVVRQTARS